MSLSARRAWIEIVITAMTSQISVTVALRKESVDRNVIFLKFCSASLVALRKESVDRNYRRFRTVQNSQIVALRKESVDRNFNAMQIVIIVVVALRKESVDRNINEVVSYSIVNRRSPQGERG